MSVPLKQAVSRSEFLYPYDPHYPVAEPGRMGEGTLQIQWIIALVTGFDQYFADRPDVFVTGDVMWYPVEGNNKITTAPDLMIVFGRPKGHRPSYMQWLEEGVGPQFVLEVFSPRNRRGAMQKKFGIYQQYGIQEYVFYDPREKPRLDVWVRRGAELVPVSPARGWVSPLLGTRFDLNGRDLVVTRPDGERLRTYPELVAMSARETEAALRAAKLAAKLRELGVDPDTV